MPCSPGKPCKNANCRCKEDGFECICTVQIILTSSPRADRSSAMHPSPGSPSHPIKTAVFQIDDLCCDGCSCNAALQSGLTAHVPGVLAVRLLLVQSQCLIDYDPRIATPEQLLETLEASGYRPLLLHTRDALISPRTSPRNEEIEPSPTRLLGNGKVLRELQQQQVKFLVEGMTCGSCVGAVESAARSVKGVGQVSVNLMTGQVGWFTITTRCQAVYLGSGIHYIGPRSV